MVIGNDPESQLEPYDENLEGAERCEGPIDEEEKQRFMDHYKDEKKAAGKSFDELYPIFGKQWDGGAARKNEEGVWCNYTTYNEKSKWDWYSLGGRWSSFFKLKPGAKGSFGRPGVMSSNDVQKKGYADQALKKDIDFEAMRDEAGKSAGETWDAVHKALDKTKELTGVTIQWSTLIDANITESMSFEERQAKAKELRETYGNQPRVMAFRAFANSKEGQKIIGWDDSLEDYEIPREQFVQNARNRACTTFAILKDGEWYEKGKMGWFGMSTDKMTQQEWNTKLQELIDSVPDDTLFSLYDLHI
jgi:hypothetical protein